MMNFGLVAQVAIEHDLLVVCDETYEYFMYGEQRHVTLATFPGMWERTLTSYTFTKAYAMSGWRLGCIVGPKQLLEPLRKVHEHTASFVSPFVQAAGIAALDGPQNHIEGWRLSCETLRSVVAARHAHRAGTSSRHSSASNGLVRAISADRRSAGHHIGGQERQPCRPVRQGRGSHRSIGAAFLAGNNADVLLLSAPGLVTTVRP